jgi:formylglycine-generating enzyme required for sulfatase activity
MSLLQTGRRYPGVASFEGADSSLFFGRPREIAELRALVLAERLVVVYSRSGLGKTSLINAGLKEWLWAQGILPVPVRLNDPEKGAMYTLHEGFEKELRKREVELVEGDRRSLWHYFKTVQLWKADDVLLTPCLLLDQFEELFTLQTVIERQRFVHELAALIRGIRPSDGETGRVVAAASPRAEPVAPDADPVLNEAPPSVKVVISLREDFLGHLDELSGAIPQILHNRFRLGPLFEEEANAAIVEPARVRDAKLVAAPFEYDEDALKGIWRFLSEELPGQDVRTRPYVEPFQLQLVCERAEDLAHARQRSGAPAAPLTWQDLGEDRGLADTLKSFYDRKVGELPAGHSRRAVRRLCEHGLISRAGRRLSLEREEIAREFDVAAGTLDLLVDQRLLRKDARVGSYYYELSHDTLVKPILGARERHERRARSLRAAAAVLLLVGLVGPLAVSAGKWWGSRQSLSASLEWVRIAPPAAGSFQMGCVPGDRNCEDDEKQRHPVPLAKPFWVMDAEVTLAQYRQFIKSARATFLGRWLHSDDVFVPPQPDHGDDRYPVVNVTWYDATAFCRFVRGRLPTEAEWEYAARGGSSERIYPWGNEFRRDLANAYQPVHRNQAGAVRSFRANGRLYDMAGNVSEWTASEYRPYPYSVGDGREGSDSRNLRVLRGGSWKEDPERLRVSFRERASPDRRGDFVGFRCVRDVSP